MKKYLKEFIRPWKLTLLSLGIALLIVGSYYEGTLSGVIVFMKKELRGG